MNEIRIPSSVENGMGSQSRPHLAQVRYASSGCANGSVMHSSLAHAELGDFSFPGHDETLAF
ncbi:hypothetical protein [Brachybacterium sp. YJGR34]|uniref:hypothetical protein n=1 Tax=Brachybacterium sp. YJGR34 TaxID=2059911 RepID=UPI0013001853|nr:hypothetical protein [Brachybacterium sp. YJGR34]